MSLNQSNNTDVKIKLVYKDFDGNIKIESVWAEKVGDYYKILNVPFFAGNIAYGDIVSIDEEEGEMYFDELIEPSGHSTIQMIIYDKNGVSRIGEELVALGCDWEGSHLEGYISVDVPATISYIPIKEYLEQGKLKNLWDYKEACLAHS
ncbi:DUF4265 domain-containing protein [Chitinophaga sancti]|uniref:DUF4265 domain-containing protein n=1 Tax=Chitinophaga sancti TaxID=1004 RepID=A0A1K1SSV5_9BACT|nr:DUF4265 domain-containing protein [Chitinophaga sancti]WQD65403.1 DUF4265 domain-containing protein [Chitinophaga sancti]WQG88973.1 DUF4265 domain-containing protein [Chitinophaga sancti]SFW87386.1 protein of unknown function [Chitinophaga sancti]